MAGDWCSENESVFLALLADTMLSSPSSSDLSGVKWYESRDEESECVVRSRDLGCLINRQIGIQIIVFFCFFKEAGIDPRGDTSKGTLLT